MKRQLILTFSILSISLFISCSKKDEPTPSSNQNPTSFYFKGKLGDSTFNFFNDVNNMYSGFNSESQVFADASTNYNRIVKFEEGAMWSRVDYNISPPDTEYHLFMLYLKTIDIADDNYDFPVKSDLDNIYTIGKNTLFSVESLNYPYEKSDGWSLMVYDSKGEAWSTYSTTPNQSNSYVNIVSRNNVNIPSGGSAYCIKGDLSCTVYNSTGQSKLLTGEFYQIVSDYTKIY
jgi:hypothetical protein